MGSGSWRPGWPSGSRCRRGQAVPLLAGVLALVVAVLVGLVALGNLVGARAGPSRRPTRRRWPAPPKGRPAAVAMAAENHGELESFAARDGEVEVTVRVGDARATSRARRQW